MLSTDVFDQVTDNPGICVQPSWLAEDVKSSSFSFVPQQSGLSVGVQYNGRHDGLSQQEAHRVMHALPHAFHNQHQGDIQLSASSCLL